MWDDDVVVNCAALEANFLAKDSRTIETSQNYVSKLCNRGSFRGISSCAGRREKRCGISEPWRSSH